jgi:glycosyltransferase involved in cell wall biosynthesis
VPLPLSAAIVCRDSERTIGRTLDSVAGLAAEIVALDSGSTDGTIGILERSGARVVRVAWQGHVATKQQALDACTLAWVLALDSDESLTPRLRASIEQALSRDDPALAGYEVNRVVYYRGRPLRHAWQPEWRLRLVRRGAARWTGLDPHDTLALVQSDAPRRVGRLDGALRHDSIETFAAFLGKQARHAEVMAASLHAAGRNGSPMRLLLSPPGAFLKQIVLKGAWRDGWPGWLAAASTAAGSLMKHAILIERSRSAGVATVEGPPSTDGPACAG